MYPLKFKKVFKEKIWGSRKLEELLEIKLPSDKIIGESWEVCSHKHGMSIVDNGIFQGLTLDFLLKEYRDTLVGKDVYNTYLDKFPLLIKYLDVNDRLSVQVHPNDEYALKVEGEFGKFESWYIIDASPDAKLIMGLASGITKEKFQEKVNKKDFSGIFNEISVKKGDFINVNPGLVHASLEGSVVICEIQQNSDSTYRIYDFDRIVDGELRPLHLDKATEVIAYGQKPEITTENSRTNLYLQGAAVQKLIRGEYYNVDKLKVDGKYVDEIYPNFKILSILDGKGFITFKANEYPFTKGDTFFIPANLDITILGNAEILKSFI